MAGTLPIQNVFATTGTNLTADDAVILELFGISVSINGDTAIVGAAGDDAAGFNSGSAYIFTRSGTEWTQTAKLTADDAAAVDRFGDSVSINGDTVIVGAEGDDAAGPDSGSAYIFNLSTNNPPTAENDDAKTLRNVSVKIDVLANDDDIDNDPLTIISVDPLPSNGVAIITLDEITYTPDNDFTGVDSFGYTISDGNDGFATATVMVTVITSEEGIGDLIDEVDELGIPQGPLTNILNPLTDSNPNNDQAACGILTGFISMIQGFIADGTITSEEGQPLIDTANDIKISLGIC